MKFIRVVAEKTLEIPLAEDSLGENLARTIWLSGELPPPALCSGLGRCGACRVHFLSEPPLPVPDEISILGKASVEQGWRLSCRHTATPGMIVELPPTSSHAPVPQQSVSEKISLANGEHAFMAVDLGTTSIQWHVFAWGSPERQIRIVDSGKVLNPQMGAGSEVISRVALSLKPHGRQLLQGLVLRLLRDIVRKSPCSIDELCVAGNTAMTSILLDRDVSGLAAAPYRSDEAGGRTVRLPDLPPIWIPPQPAPFVGGDLSSGMAFLLYDQKLSFPFLLADMGTNGEFVLALNERESYITSVPLGPSIEGIGLAHGGTAAPGSISAFRLGPAGLQGTVIGGGRAQNICGTGYLSLLDVLFRAGFLDEHGRPVSVPSSPLARRLGARMEHDASGMWRLPLQDGLCLSGADVEELLKVKAAFSVALDSLLEKAGLSSRDLAHFVLGGALGEYAPLDALENLGFLPQGAGTRTIAAGNTSLQGAVLLLQQRELRPRIVEWSENCKAVELTGRADFMNNYVRHMHFGNAG